MVVFHKYSCVEATSLLVQQYSFLNIQIVTNDRNLQLAASLSILFLADPTQSMPNHGCRIILDSQLTRHCRLGWVALECWVEMRNQLPAWL